MAIFNRDYRRIAELHVQAGWMPAHIRIDELEAAARAVCEPYFTRPLSEISLAEVLVKLFRTAQRYELTLQPQLILLQKTLLNIEGVGRQLDPGIDIWAVAKPVLETILRERYSRKRLLGELRKRMPELITRAPDMPRLLHAWLQQQVDGSHRLGMHSADVREIAQVLKAMQRRIVSSIRCRRAEGAGAAGIDVDCGPGWPVGAVGGVATAMKLCTACGIVKVPQPATTNHPHGHRAFAPPQQSRRPRCVSRPRARA